MAEFRWIHTFLSVILMLQLTGRNTDTFINEIIKVRFTLWTLMILSSQQILSSMNVLPH